MIAIRAASTDDIDQMLVLWRHLEDVQGPHRIFGLAEDAEEIVRGHLVAALESADARAVVAADEGLLVGMAIGWMDERRGSLDAEPLADLSRVVIAPDRRGEGIGVALVDDIEAWARERGARWLQARLFSGNERGRAFWERIGFVPRYEARVRPIGAPVGSAQGTAETTSA